MRHLVWFAVFGCAKPEIAEPFIVPATPTSADPLIVILPGGWEDVPANQLATTWYVDGVQAGTGPNLPPEAHARGDTVYATLSYEGDVRHTAPVTIGNAPPVVSAVTVSPDPLSSAAATVATFTVTDPDETDVLTPHFAWTVNGVPAGTDASTLPAGSFGGEDLVRVDVVVEDDFGGRGRGFAEATAPNEPPSAPSIRLYPDRPLAGAQHLVCDVLVPSVDADGDALTYTFTWTLNGAPWTGTAGTTRRPGDTVPTAALAAGQTWTCAASVSDGQGSAAATSAPQTVRARVFTDLAVIGEGTCVFRDDGASECAGPNAGGQLELPAGSWRTIRSGVGWACGLDDAGSVSCWGSGDAGSEAIRAVPAGAYLDVDVNDHVAVGVLESGEIVGWGDTTWLRGRVPDGDFVRVAIGPDAADACALDEDGAIACWGDWGRILDRVPGGSYIDIATHGPYASCAVREDGVIRCWGQESTPAALTTPPSGTEWREIRRGRGHFCALGAAGQVACWGDGVTGAHLGVPPGPFSALAVGQQHSCALTAAGALTCWGTRAPAVRPGGTGAATDFAAAAGNLCTRSTEGAWSCALSTSLAGFSAAGLADVQLTDTAACGRDAAGALRCTPAAGSPVTAAPSGTFSAFSLGTQLGCALDAGGLAQCWGATGGLGSLPAAQPMTAIAAGNGNACGLYPDGLAWCWGAGVGSVGQTWQTFTQVAVESFACGVQTGGGLACWGGDGQPAPTGSYTSVDTGDRLACAIGGAGNLVCWTQQGFSAPFRIDTPSGVFTTLDVRGDQACALGLDGRVWCDGAWVYRVGG